MNRIPALTYFWFIKLVFIACMMSPKTFAFQSCENALMISGVQVSVLDVENIRGLSASMYAIRTAETLRQRNEAVRDATSFANRLFDYLCNLSSYIENGGEDAITASEMRQQLISTRNYLADLVGLKTIDLKLALSARVRAIATDFHPTYPIGFFPSSKRNDLMKPSKNLIGGNADAVTAPPPPSSTTPATVTRDSQPVLGFQPNQNPPYGRTEKVQNTLEKSGAGIGHSIIPIGLDHNSAWMRDFGKALKTERIPMGFERKMEPFVDDDFVLAMYLNPREGVFKFIKIPVKK